MLCADSAIPKLEIFGPYGLMHYLATMRGYTYRYVRVLSLQRCRVTRWLQFDDGRASDRSAVCARVFTPDGRQTSDSTLR